MFLIYLIHRHDKQKHEQRRMILTEEKDDDNDGKYCPRKRTHKHTVEIKSLFPNEKRERSRKGILQKEEEEEEYKQTNRRNTVH